MTEGPFRLDEWDLIVILGFGGHARSVADVALAAGARSLLFVDDNVVPGESFHGHATSPTMPAAIEGRSAAFAASGDHAARAAALDRHPTASIVRVVAPSATIGIGAEIGAAVFIAHHAHIGPDARIGRGTIVNTHAVVDHESVVGSFSHVSVHSTIAGRSRIGDRVFVGAGATVIDGISVCDDVTIGAGATVVADITVPGTYLGTPARRHPTSSS